MTPEPRHHDDSCPEHESVDVEVDPSPHACGGPAAAAGISAATAPVAKGPSAVWSQADQLENSPKTAECLARLEAMVARPRSASATRRPSRPSSAHGHPFQRMPLTSIAFAQQAMQPRAATPEVPAVLQRPQSASGVPTVQRPSSAGAVGVTQRPSSAGAVRQIQALKEAKRCMSAGSLQKPTPPHGLVGEKYRMVHYLGKGTSAQVWEAVDEREGKSDRKVAIKVFDKHKGNWASRSKQAIREAKLLQALNHPAIVKVFETFDAPFKFHIVLELLTGGSLRQLLVSQRSPGLDEVTCRNLFEQICGGLRFCHGRNIVHRDLKLENIILESPTGPAKIIDFGFALQLRSFEQRLRVFCGTPSYMAPELVMGKEYSGFCTDMWALGIVLFGMLTGRLPFEGQTESQLFSKIRRGTFRFPEGVSELPQRLISGILRIDAPSRSTASQALQHRWVTQQTNDTSEGQSQQSVPRARPSSVPAYMRRLRSPLLQVHS